MRQPSKALSNRENLLFAINNCNTYGDVLKSLGLRAAGGNFQTLKKYIEKFNIDTTRIEQSIKNIRKNAPIKAKEKKFSLDVVLIEDSLYNRGSLKRRLYKEKLKIPQCEFCGQGEIWRGEKISLILDHVNGVYNDNRLENLRILCPNCNATLDTHCGKNKNKYDNERNKVAKEPKPRKSLRCKKEDIEKLVWDIPCIEVAKIFNVSDRAIGKWCEHYKITKPDRGFWAKYSANILEGQSCPLPQI